MLEPLIILTRYLWCYFFQMRKLRHSIIIQLAGVTEPFKVDAERQESWALTQTSCFQSPCFHLSNFTAHCISFFIEKLTLTVSKSLLQPIPVSGEANCCWQPLFLETNGKFQLYLVWPSVAFDALLSPSLSWAPFLSLPLLHLILLI